MRLSMMMMTNRTKLFGAMLVLAVVPVFAQTPSLAPDNQRGDHRDGLPARREERFLHDDAIRLVGSHRPASSTRGTTTTGRGGRKSPTSTTSATKGPNKDVISADFTAMVGPAEEFGALGYTDVPVGGLFVKPGVGALKRDEMNYNHSRPY